MIVGTENSGTVDAGLGEMGVELVGMVIVCVLLQPLVCPQKQGERGIVFLYRSMPQGSMKKWNFTQNFFLYNCEVLTAARVRQK